MKLIKPDIDGSFWINCVTKKNTNYEHFNPEHLLVYQVSGETQVFYQQKSFVLRAGQLLLARKNQLLKSLDASPQNVENRAIAIVLKAEDLMRYANLYHPNCQCNTEPYKGNPNWVMKPDNYLKSYFQSLTPYLNEPQGSNQRMAFSKVAEAVELLLNLKSELDEFLFDFSELHKIDLEKFMLLNYRHNTPVEHFARLTGRSLASFKRDFEKIFGTSPAKWLKNKRLEEAHFLIRSKGKKPAEIYLELGFENLSHFYTAFKQKYGVTPSEVGIEPPVPQMGKNPK